MTDKEYRICKECSIVLEDLRTGMTAVFDIKNMIEDQSADILQLRGKDLRGLGYVATLTVHEMEESQ